MAIVRFRSQLAIRCLGSFASVRAGDFVKFASTNAFLDQDSNIRITDVNDDLKSDCPHLRILAQETKNVQQWNHEYWKHHNKVFFEEKEKFLKDMKQSNESSEKSTADELSIFYKDFLNRYYGKHMRYNWEWYKKNFSLMWLNLKYSLRTSMEKQK